MTKLNLRYEYFWLIWCDMAVGVGHMLYCLFNFYFLLPFIRRKIYYSTFRFLTLSLFSLTRYSSSYYHHHHLGMCNFTYVLRWRTCGVLSFSFYFQLSNAHMSAVSSLSVLNPGKRTHRKNRETKSFSCTTFSLNNKCVQTVDFIRYFAKNLKKCTKNVFSVLKAHLRRPGKNLYPIYIHKDIHTWVIVIAFYLRM